MCTGVTSDGRNWIAIDVEEGVAAVAIFTLLLAISACTRPMIVLSKTRASGSQIDFSASRRRSKTISQFLLKTSKTN